MKRFKVESLDGDFWDSAAKGGLLSLFSRGETAFFGPWTHVHFAQMERISGRCLAVSLKIGKDEMYSVRIDPKIR